MSPRSFPGRSVHAAFLAIASLVPAVSVLPADLIAADTQNRKRAARSLGVASGRAYEFFASRESLPWDEALKSLRPPVVPADQKARSLALVRKEDVIEPSPARQAKIDALLPVLTYLDRATATQVKILRLDLAWAGFLEGAAVLISPAAVDLLTPAELQAVIAHELAHEYFAAEYDTARARKDYDTVKEIELRCDAVAIVTMVRLGLDQDALLSGVAKLIQFNERRGAPNSRDLAPSWDERRSFGRAVAELAR